jgi:hypothetical protein
LRQGDSYVDDIDRVGRTVRSVKEAFLALSAAAKTMGLNVNFLTLSSNLMLHKTLQRAVLMYGSEIWTVTRSNEEGLRFFQGKILRKIFGLVCENGLWHAMYNNELYGLLSDSHVVKTTKIGRLRWTGHVNRILNDSAIKVLNSPPRTRWV